MLGAGGHSSNADLHDFNMAAWWRHGTCCRRHSTRPQWTPQGLQGAIHPLLLSGETANRFVLNLKPCSHWAIYVESRRSTRRPATNVELDIDDVQWLRSVLIFGLVEGFVFDHGWPIKLVSVLWLMQTIFIIWVKRRLLLHFLFIYRCPWNIKCGIDHISTGIGAV